MKTIHWTQHWNHISASLRLLIISITGLAAFFLLPSDTSLTIRIDIAWVIAGSAYLILTYVMMYSSNENNMLTLAKKEDAGAAIILLITILASLASLFTIVLILSAAKSLPMSESIKHIVLVLATFAVSWLLVHTAFALHYAHAYYQEYEKTQLIPLMFANKPKPTYVDFLYFSMVIGMTCQTADVNIASSRIRFLVMMQGMTAFIFNTSLLALAMNLIAGVFVFDKVLPADIGSL
jgi:uncharacterized membrane protein